MLKRSVSWENNSCRLTCSDIRLQRVEDKILLSGLMKFVQIAKNLALFLTLQESTISFSGEETPSLQGCFFLTHFTQSCGFFVFFFLWSLVVIHIPTFPPQQFLSSFLSFSSESPSLPRSSQTSLDLHFHFFALF